MKKLFFLAVFSLLAIAGYAQSNYVSLDGNYIIGLDGRKPAVLTMKLTRPNGQSNTFYAHYQPTYGPGFDVKTSWNNIYKDEVITITLNPPAGGKITSYYSWYAGLSIKSCDAYSFVATVPAWLLESMIKSKVPFVTLKVSW